MAEKSKYSNVYVCGILVSDWEMAFAAYRSKTEGGEIQLPSLPHFLSGLPKYVGEDDLQAYLQQSEGKGGTYKTGATTVRKMLQWFRGQYLSNPGWSGAHAQKAILALGRNFGDGVSYTKDGTSKTPDKLQIQFGSDEMSGKAGK